MEFVFTVGYKVLEATNIIMAEVFKFLAILQLHFSAKHVQIDTEFRIDTETCGSYNELYEIFSWMPAKSIIKYSSSLCKGLSKIHLEPRFIKKQCIRSCGQENGFFLQPRLRRHGLHNLITNIIELHVLPWQTSSDFGIPYECIEFILDHGRILSSSNGLLLLESNEDDVIEFRLFNPATMIWAPLPTPEGFKFIVNEDVSPLIECYPWAALGVIQFPDDYTIALPVKCEIEGVDEQQLLICSNGSWEEELCDVSIEGRVLRYDMPVAIFSTATQGLVVHYLCDSDNGVPGYSYLEPYIAAFDMREKTLSRQIKLPDGAWDMEYDNQQKGSRHKLLLFKWNDTSMCLVRWFKVGGELTAWVLDDYDGCRESWRWVMKKTEKELLGFNDREWVMEVGVASGKGLLLATQATIYVYVFDLQEEEDRGRLELVGQHGLGCWNVTFMSYANTLRPISD